jgi:hypothetical protein
MICDDHHVLSHVRPTMTSKMGPNVKHGMYFLFHLLMNISLAYKVEIKDITYR